RAGLGLLLVLTPLLGLAAPAAAQTDPCPEPNNGFKTACFVGPGTPVVQGVISSPDDVDAYRFEVNVPLAQVHIELGNLPADYDLHIFGGNAQLFTEATTSGLAPDVVDLVLPTGIYFIFVNSAQGQF